MITTLTTIKGRLGLPESDVKDDDLLNAIIEAVGARFDKETRRTLARNAAATEEFAGDEMELRLGNYPVESVTSFHLKSDETTGWELQSDVVYLLRKGCVVSLGGPLGAASQQLKVTYAGGYVMPDATVSAGQTALPKDLELAGIEQVLFVYRHRDRLGIASESGGGGSIAKPEQDLIPSVAAVLKRYERWVN